MSFEKSRYEYLKKRNEQYKQMWETNKLFTECLTKLGNDVAIFSSDKSNVIRLNYGDNIYRFVGEDLYHILITHKKEYFYVFWDTNNVPVICAPIENIYNNLIDVTAVGFDTYIVSLDYKVAVIFDHNNFMRILST